MYNHRIRVQIYVIFSIIVKPEVNQYDVRPVTSWQVLDGALSQNAFYLLSRNFRLRQR